jgi:hypothetical protein
VLSIWCHVGFNTNGKKTSHGNKKCRRPLGTAGIESSNAAQ